MLARFWDNLKTWLNWLVNFFTQLWDLLDDTISRVANVWRKVILVGWVMLVAIAKKIYDSMTNGTSMNITNWIARPDTPGASDIPVGVEILQFANVVLCLDIWLWAITTFCVYLVGFAVYRFAKSWIPTIG